MTLWVEVSHSKSGTTLGDHRHCGRRNITDLMFHVTLQDHVMKGFRNLWQGEANLSTLPNLVAIGIMVVDI